MLFFLHLSFCVYWAVLKASKTPSLTGRIGSRRQPAENVWLVSLGCSGGPKWYCGDHLHIIQLGLQGKPKLQKIGRYWSFVDPAQPRGRRVFAGQQASSAPSVGCCPRRAPSANSPASSVGELRRRAPSASSVGELRPSRRAP